MATGYLNFGPFLGVMSEVNPTGLPLNYATASLNGRFEDGLFRTRRGWRNWVAANGSFTAWHGAGFVRGYAAVGDPKKALIVIENRGGTRKPYEINLDTGAKSEITDSGTPLNLTNGDYEAISFNGDAIVFRKGGTVYRHAIGTLTSWLALDADRPANASTPTIGSLYEPPTSPVSGTPFSWTGATGADVTDLVLYSWGSVETLDGSSYPMPAPESGDYGRLSTGNINGASSYVCEVSAILGGPLDWSDQEYILCPFVLDSQLGNRTLSINSCSIQVSLVNSSGTEQALTETWEGYNVKGLVSAIGKFTIPAGANSAVTSDVTKLKFVLTYTISGTVTAPNYFRSTINIGEITPTVEGAGVYTPPALSGDEKRVRFGIVHYDEERGVESAEPTPSAWMKLDPPNIWFTDSNVFMGDSGITVSGFGPSGLPGTTSRLYVQFEDDAVWRLIGKKDGASPSWSITETFGVLSAYPARIDHEPTPVGSPSCAATYKGFVVWGYETGGQNVKMSAVGSPGRLARNTDTAGDLEAGATWSLADGFDDAPKWFGGAGDALIALGARAAYTSIGDYPVQMTPFKRIPKSKGVLGTCACRWTDDAGMPGVAYLGADLEVWKLLIVRGSANDYGEPLIELTKGIRGKVREFLLQTETPDLTKLAIGVDERTDSLWLTYADRAMVLRRATVTDGQRAWEFYSYAGGDWAKWVFAENHGIKALRTTGQIDEFERRSDTNAELTGTNRDGGSAMPTAYWEHAGRTDVARERWFSARVYRPAATTCTLKISSNGNALVSYPVSAALSGMVRFSQNQVGYRHTFRIEIGETDGAIERAIVETRRLGKQRDSE